MVFLCVRAPCIGAYVRIIHGRLRDCTHVLILQDLELRVFGCRMSFVIKNRYVIVNTLELFFNFVHWNCFLSHVQFKVSSIQYICTTVFFLCSIQGLF